MPTMPFISAVAIGFVIIFGCAIYTLSQGAAPAQAAVESTGVTPMQGPFLTYVEGRQAEPPAWPDALSH